MSATTQSTSDSTDSETVVEVNPLGLLSNDRYMNDLDGLTQKATSQIQAMADTLGQIDTVVVRQSYALCEALEDVMSEHDALPDVEYYSLDFRQLLDDTSDIGNGYAVSGVKLTAREKAARRDDADASAFSDDQPIASLVAAQDLDDSTLDEMYEALDQVDDTFTAPRSAFDVEEHFDLRIREHKNAIPMREVSQNRINRAKAKALAKESERLQNDWYDSVPTVDGVIILSDGTSRGETRLAALDGENPFVKYPEAHTGPTVELNCEHDGFIDWTRYLLETGNIEVDDLSDSQRDRLTTEYDAAALEDMGISVSSSPSSQRDPAAEAAAVAGTRT